MTLKSFLLHGGASLCLLLPAMASAQETPDHAAVRPAAAAHSDEGAARAVKGGKRPAIGRAKTPEKAPDTAHPGLSRPESPPRNGANPANGPQEGGGPRTLPPQQPPTGTGLRPSMSSRPGPGDEGQPPPDRRAETAPPRAANPAPGPRPSQRPANTAKLSGWSRPPAAGPARQEAAASWRDTHQRWDGNAPWRQDHNWWRGSEAFSLFAGVRVGYYFVPGHGYVAYPADYRPRAWKVGEYLPNWLWGASVGDYWTYGLPEAPEGCAWIWVDRDVALIDTSDGYILDIAQDVW